MDCPNCGMPNELTAKFCVECATPFGRACPSCGHSNTPTAKFCSECATPLAAALGGTARTVTGANATTSMSATVAERRLVTVLFADLVGFTPFAEERDAEAVREMLSRYFEIAQGIVERYGGTIEKFIGDAVMAVWGTPVAHEDDAERAVRAGLDLVDSVRALGPGIEARAGLLTGEVAVTLGATGQGMVAGDLVNTAARLQSVAPPGGVLVGEATMNAASEAIAFEEAGEQVLKGKASPVAAWKATRVVAQRRGQGRSDLPEPPFVGRDEEMRLLRDLIATTGRDRRTRLVSITGPGGIGKSRLAWELEKYIDGIVETIYWHRGRSPSYGDGIAFWALGEMVRRRAGLAEDDDEATTRARISDTVASFVPDEADRRWIEPALLALLGLEPPPAGGRDVLFAAWRMFFERIAANGTTILLFEDLHWADAGLLDFIDYLIEWSKTVPILVVTLARPEIFDRRRDWGALTRNFTSVTLEPLSPEMMGELLRGFVPGLPDGAVGTIVARADGIPLYAVETVRALLADGRLERVDGTYRPTGELRDIAIPATLRSLIASRLDALDQEDRDLLQNGAVLGQTFTLGALSSVVGRTGEELGARLRGLVRRELLVLEADPRSPERGQYGFVQGLIREVAYGTLARRERRARHLAAARHYESLGEDELAGALAAHYLAAREASDPGPEADAIAIQARIAFTAAAERSAGLGSHGEAIAQLRHALDVATEPSDRIELLTRAARSAESAADFTSGVAFAQEASDLAIESGDQPAAARALGIMGATYINAGQMVAAVEALESALASLPESEQGEARAELLTNLARAYMRNDDNDATVTTADLALQIAERLELDRLIAEGFNSKAGGLSGAGRRREAIALMEAAIKIARAGGHIAAEIRALSNLASVVSAEDPRRSHTATLQALDLARRYGHRPMLTWSLMFHGWWARMEGDDWDEPMQANLDEIEKGAEPADEARLLIGVIGVRIDRGEPVADLLARRGSLVKGTTDPFALAMQDLLMGNAALAAGDLETAYEWFLRSVLPGLVYPLGLAARAAVRMGDLDRLRVAVDRLDTDPEVPHDARLLLLSAHAGLDALEGRTSEAVHAFQAAIELARERGQHWEEAQISLDLAAGVGVDHPEARRTAEAARPVLERLGARPWLAIVDAMLSGTAAAPTEGALVRR